MDIELSEVVKTRIFRARRNPQHLPDWGWDRDCRVCMAEGNDFGRRGEWAPGDTVYIWQRTDEPFQAWHTDEDLARYDAELDRLSPEVKQRMGIS